MTTPFTKPVRIYFYVVLLFLILGNFFCGCHILQGQNVIKFGKALYIYSNYLKMPLRVSAKHNYFMKEKIVEQIASQFSTAYILKEPYRSDPEKFLSGNERLELELKRVVQSKIKVKE